MEISIIKANGCEVQVIFTGKLYLFHNDFFGWLAQAVRDEENDNKFTLITGNENALGSHIYNAIIPAAKRFIRKSENKYISREISFDEDRQDLSRLNVTLSVSMY